MRSSWIFQNFVNNIDMLLFIGYHKKNFDPTDEYNKAIEKSELTKMSEAKINLPSQKIADFCKENHIAKLSLFGSVLRDDFRLDSDIDFIVEFEPGKAPGLINYSRMERELAEIIGYPKIDLRTPQELSKYFRDEVLAHAEVQYAAG